MTLNTKTSSKDTYISLKKETTEATPVVPDTYLVYKTCDADIETEKVMSGNIEGIHAQYTESVLGKRTNKASLTFDMNFNDVGYVLHQTCGDPSTVDNGDSTYTHTFTLQNSLPTYTWGFGKGVASYRLAGAFGESFTIGSSGADVLINVDFATQARKGLNTLITDGNTSIGTPATIDVRTDAGFTTAMLVVGDIITIGLGTTNQEDTAVVAITDSNTFTANCTKTHTSGDIVVLRQVSSPSYADVRPASFVKPLNTVKMADAVGDLAGSSNITVDSLTFTFNNNLDVRHGESSSDPYSIASISSGIELHFEKVGTEEEMIEISKHSHAIRRAIQFFFSGEIIGSGSQREELTLEVPKAEITNFPIPVGSPDEMLVASLDARAVYDRTTSKSFTITLTNEVASF